MVHEPFAEHETPTRFEPGRALPAYAYRPGGRHPHPARDPGGHSYGDIAAQVSEPALDSENFRWGADLFNHGFYWEAHEAWEPLWRAAKRSDPRRALLKGLILMAAAGVKVLEDKAPACAKHAGRAATLFRDVAVRAPTIAGLAMTPVCLARHAESVAERPPALATRGDVIAPVFDFVVTPEA